MNYPPPLTPAHAALATLVRQLQALIGPLLLLAAQLRARLPGPAPHWVTEVLLCTEVLDILSQLAEGRLAPAPAMRRRGARTASTQGDLARPAPGLHIPARRVITRPGFHMRPAHHQPPSRLIAPPEPPIFSKSAGAATPLHAHFVTISYYLGVYRKRWWMRRSRGSGRGIADSRARV